jgi:hypothetical protein
MFRRGGRRASPSEAQELLPDRRYAVIRIGTADYAYTTCGGYLKALGQAWAAGLSPEPRPGAMGRDLSGVARPFGGVDVDLSELGDLDRTRPRPA